MNADEVVVVNLPVRQAMSFVFCVFSFVSGIDAKQCGRGRPRQAKRSIEKATSGLSTKNQYHLKTTSNPSAQRSQRKSVWI
jgi:hypothetical protein